AAAAPERKAKTIGVPPRRWYSDYVEHAAILVEPRPGKTDDATDWYRCSVRKWSTHQAHRPAAPTAHRTAVPEFSVHPTRVGTTFFLTHFAAARPVHPHARGDDSRTGGRTRAAYGPPPRAWGRRRPDPFVSDVGRSTPTRVGTTPEQFQWSRPVPVHPHARGDDVFGSDGASGQVGPPPRAWGRRRPGQRDGRDGRSTPTRVGTTPSAPRRPRSWPVHPHARGDDVSVGAWALGRTGPPPRAWGRQRRKEVSGFDCRSTPTRVGTTKTRGTETTSRTVHPHARGDDAYTNPGYVFEHGPPPRAWGRPTPTTVSSPP